MSLLLIPCVTSDGAQLALTFTGSLRQTIQATAKTETTNLVGIWGIIIPSVTCFFGGTFVVSAFTTGTVLLVLHCGNSTPLEPNVQPNQQFPVVLCTTGVQCKETTAPWCPLLHLRRCPQRHITTRAAFGNKQTTFWASVAGSTTAPLAAPPPAPPAPASQAS